MFTWKTALCVLAIGVHVCAEKASALHVSNIPACTSRPVRICAGDVKLRRGALINCAHTHLA